MCYYVGRYVFGQVRLRVIMSTGTFCDQVVCFILYIASNASTDKVHCVV